jgi:lipid II:glycine glycyltransferase (peptidoglycan interpeptide bridge formation enzyme)
MEKESCKKLYEGQKSGSFEQNPDWNQLLNGENKYFIFRKGEEIISYTIVQFPQRRVAHIPFGPISVSKTVAVKSLKLIIEHFRQKKFYYLSIQLFGPVSNATEFIEYKLNSEYDIKYFFDRRNWSTSIIDLEKDIQSIIKNFSTNHKRSVKKAKKLDIVGRVIKESGEIEKFNDIYIRMYRSRGRKVSRKNNLKFYHKLLEFFEDEKNGFFYGVFKDKEMIGGIIIIIQGDTGFYYHAATDPDKRKLPIQHLGIVSLLEKLQARGIKKFDFGGYNHLVDKKDQVFNINRFKDGFTREYVFYPKLMYIEFIPKSVKMLEWFQSFKNVVKKVVRK